MISNGNNDKATSPGQTSHVTHDPNDLISFEAGNQYWNGVEATLNGVMGGHAFLNTIDLRGSRAFLAKLGIGEKEGKRVARVLEGGAG
jgi:protein N-terminal methyltransferase